MNLSRLITGLLGVSFGIFIISKETGILPFIFGGIFIVVGIVILFNKKEDEIEKIKSVGGKK